jgi:beta-lactamase class A
MSPRDTLQNVWNHTATIPLACLVVGVGMGFFVDNLVRAHGAVDDEQSDSFVEWRMPSSDGSLTNPVLECREGKAISSKKVSFKSELETYVAQIKKAEGLNRVGVSFRDLNNGPSFGIDRDSPFLSASLLKVPVMMAFYKAAEEKPGILKERLVFKKTDLPVSNLIPPKDVLVDGASYTVEELLRRMVIYSDNDALYLLTTKLPIEEMRSIYEMLGMNYDAVAQSGGSMSVQEYSSFFRILFNASYLNKQGSEKALSLLSESAFNRALRAGVPDESIKVAHKFGERTLEKGTQHFHDCGIVYYPRHPYLLCVMTQGRDIEAQSRAIASISTFVFQKMEKQYKDE